jgi:hypothetical protein
MHLDRGTARSASTCRLLEPQMYKRRAAILFLFHLFNFRMETPPRLEAF